MAGGLTLIPSIRLGPTDIELRPLGLGAWAWGDKRFWQFDPTKGPEDARQAFEATLEAGITFIDTAEIYGRGLSERILGNIVRETGRKAFIATKFAPLPYRLRTQSLVGALDASLGRLGVDQVGLYQVHWPYSILRIEPLMEQLTEAVNQGKIRHVGVSNYSAAQMRKAHAALARHGVPLVSNQVNYSLLKRSPEVNGVLDACRELGVTLIAYSPIAQGALTGKYRPGGRRVAGIRRFTRTFRQLDRAMPVVETLDRIGKKYDRTPGQVALNWLARQGNVLPIPGAKNRQQAAENAAAIDFAITDDEAAELDRVSLPWRK